jgi:hypothetical protein
VRTIDEPEKIERNQQSKYPSGVGILLYLIQYFRSDLANVVRGSGKCMDGAKYCCVQRNVEGFEINFLFKGLLPEVESNL